MVKKWRKYKPSMYSKNGSNCFWQKLIFQIEMKDKQEDEKIFADIIEWGDENKAYELDIQIPERVSITGMTINITNFNYEKLNFDIIEKDAKKIIRALIK